ncbi:MAG: type II toxin-antitoxin system HicB family antitoxin [Candidatus Nealsonbacteria bacterium CG_4_8_14_3_um_filter_39_7]|uniref:HicB family protein n=1 Tax=Candidatus Nealsonbacteria bacterium CG23_combo_of_CG06-09_8_20_14_all_39_17 TaxID=1974722 RepID=A0A2G9YVS4_9BACT|nr:MAG: HicB family protein [Candidatus Nealsonbacteria bacterium CG23_combo_of_CG06-09_8_20_14_all_39_17]PIW91171.1 MAG: type II toxin-antitoxin system HicB family antitoxin [Candidatus Nealsonbacteria bacterium CG_4_8_14_3_um_filter_39_7]
MTNYRFTIVIEKDKDGFFALCPELQGCYAQGETYEESLINIKDALRLHVKDRAEQKEKICVSKRNPRMTIKLKSHSNKTAQWWWALYSRKAILELLNNR